MKMCHFRAQHGPFALNKSFSVKTINITFFYLLALFIVQNFKKLLGACAIFGPKMANLPKQEFFSENPLISLVPFSHVYLHAKKHIQILIY